MSIGYQDDGQQHNNYTRVRTLLMTAITHSTLLGRSSRLKSRLSALVSSLTFCSAVSIFSLLASSATAEIEFNALAGNYNVGELGCVLSGRYGSSIEKIEHQKQLQSFLVATQQEHGPYSSEYGDQLMHVGYRLAEMGDTTKARQTLTEALNLHRVNHGLYTDSQVPILDCLLQIDAEEGNWSNVNELFVYLEQLYRNIYTPNDPRLAFGLARISEWYVIAHNSNLEGKWFQHLLNARKLLENRYEMAKLTTPEKRLRNTTLWKNLDYSRSVIFSLRMNSGQ